MFYRFLIGMCLTLALAGPAISQSSSNLFIRPDLRLFTTMTALNAAGFDVELGSQYHPVRQAVRDAAKNLSPDLVNRLRDYYQKRKGNESDDAQLAKYVSLAVSLTDPPDFQLTYRAEALPPDARLVLDFVDLLREVYREARITLLWSQFRQQYQNEINKMAPNIREALVRADAYMHVPLGQVTSRVMAIYLELAAPINSVNFRSYQDNYYVVLGASTTPQIDQIRHAYLHFQLDNQVAANVSKIEGGNTLLGLVANQEGLDKSYTNDLYVMVVESLIRALELRMDRTPVAQAKEFVDGHYRTGLLLTPYFYDRLAEYEKVDDGLPNYFVRMASDIDLDSERQRFHTSFAQIPLPVRSASRPEVPQTSPAATLNPLRDLLKQGEAALNAKNMGQARAAFEKALAEHDATNGPALYGMALVASDAGDVEGARDYFTKTLASTTAEPWMTVWSNIYMARIYDLECKRDQAIEYYNRAIQAGDNTRNAQAVAREGTKKPYGNACQ